MSIKKPLLQLKFVLRTKIASEPGLHFLHLPVIWWTQYKMRGHIDVRECRVAMDRELVIDGFQGSGNSFATGAFKHAQGEPVKIAHHLHSPAQIIKAVRLEIPTLVTIRKPRGAVVSLISRWNYVTFTQALRSYINFYRKVSPYSEGYLISPFDQTISNLSEVFEELNQRFGTHFEVFEHTEENVDKVRNHTSGSPIMEAKRRERKQQLRSDLENVQYRELLAEADEVYDFMAAGGVEK